MLRVVFICSGNICRSPMASVVFQHEASLRKIPHVAISMGTLGLVNRPAAQEAIDACAAVGIDLSYHRSQPISKQILSRATHIFVMEPAHKRILQQQGIDASRILFLGSWDPEDTRPQIDDPVNQPRAVFDSCLARIHRAVVQFLDTGLSES